MEHAFQQSFSLYLREAENPSLHVRTDKGFVKLWKDAFTKFDTNGDLLQLSMNNGGTPDIGAIHDLKDVLIMTKLIQFHDVINYTVESLA